MSESLFVFNENKLKEFIKSTVAEALSEHLKEKDPPQIEQQVVYRSRKYVKDLLHTTYPTIRKYSNSGLLNPIYFGRKVLFREDELNLAVPRIKTIMNHKQKETE